MNQQAVSRWARVVGHIGWWIFVVAMLFAGGVYWWDSYRSSILPHRGGWTAYTSLTDDADYHGAFTSSLSVVYDDTWSSASVYALIAFVVVVLAAVIEAVVLRRVIPGLVTVAVPFIALGLFVLATPTVVDGLELRWELAMVIVLAGIAIREGWTRVVVPRITPSRRT